MYSSSRLAKRDGADCYWFFVIMNIIQKCTWQDQIQNHNDHVLDCFLINWNGWQLNFDLKLGTFPDKGDDMILIIICYKINWLSGWSTKQCQSETLTFSDYEWLKLNYFMNLFLKLIIPKVASIYYVLNQHHDINQEIRQKLVIIVLLQKVEAMLSQNWGTTTVILTILLWAKLYQSCKHCSQHKHETS